MAKCYVLACDRHYDVVIADLFHPARDGAGSLYTVEHFQAIKSLLNPNGIFCQWLPLYQIKTTDPQKLLDAVGEQLLSVVRRSMDFSAAYDPLLAVARELYPADPAAAQDLLQRLEEANPRRVEARLLRQRLDPGT